VHDNSARDEFIKALQLHASLESMLHEYPAEDLAACGVVMGSLSKLSLEDWGIARDVGAHMMVVESDCSEALRLIDEHPPTASDFSNLLDEIQMFVFIIPFMLLFRVLHLVFLYFFNFILSSVRVDIVHL